MPCRAGADTAFSFGEPYDLIGKYAWSFTNSLEKSHPVGSLRPNDLGVFDMHGNASEWCTGLDGFSAEERGGSFFDAPGGVRSAYRAWYAPTVDHARIGFRVAKTCSR